MLAQAGIRDQLFVAQRSRPLCRNILAVRRRLRVV
jgi:hypothetical protein